MFLLPVTFIINIIIYQTRALRANTCAALACMGAAGHESDYRLGQSPTVEIVSVPAELARNGPGTS